LQNGKRPYISEINFEQYATKSRIIRLTPEENSSHEMIHQIIPVNCSIEEKENCIILYATCNFLYPESLQTLVDRIKSSDFVGHIIYRIGGWPNVEDGDLRLAHIPYSFKVCAFKEAQRLGYKKALWLDAPMRPYVSLNTIFSYIEEKKFFTYNLPHTLYSLCDGIAHLKRLDINTKKAKKFYTIAVGILGIDFTDEIAVKVLDDWYDHTRNNEAASCTKWVETNLLSLVINKYYRKSYFPPFLKHIYCPQTNKVNDRPTLDYLHFSYTKKDVEPNWPNYDKL
jgi:hypothetical protein